MSYRMKITLPEPTMTGLRALADQQGEPASRIAAQMVRDALSEHVSGVSHRPPLGLPAPIEQTNPDRRAQWLEPYLPDSEWHARMWGSIVALHSRYPHELAHLKDGWWDDTTHLETLGALVVWRDWIDSTADDPRHELAFHAQLADYSRALRQEGGGVSRTWQPGAPPETWVR